MLLSIGCQNVYNVQRGKRQKCPQPPRPAGGCGAGVDGRYGHAAHRAKGGLNQRLEFRQALQGQAGLFDNRFKRQILL